MPDSERGRRLSWFDVAHHEVGVFAASRAYSGTTRTAPLAALVAKAA
jgi:hypothetical protein